MSKYLLSCCAEGDARNAVTPFAQTKIIQASDRSEALAFSEFVGYLSVFEGELLFNISLKSVCDHHFR